MYLDYVGVMGVYTDIITRRSYLSYLLALCARVQRTICCCFNLPCTTLETPFSCSGPQEAPPAGQIKNTEY